MLTGLVVLLVGLLAPLREGTASGRSLTPQAAPKVTVAWVFNLDHLMSCKTPARELRRMQRRLGTELHVSAVAVGMDPSIASSFFRVERLEADVMSLTGPQYRRVFGSALAPGLYVIQDGTVVKRIDPLDRRTAGDWRTDLDETVQAALELRSSPPAGSRLARHEPPARRIRWPDMRAFRWQG